MNNENFIKRMPNWLRYLLALPLSILSIIPIDIIIFISNWLYSDINSVWYFISNFIVANVLNILIFFFSLNYILPKYKFGVTVTFNAILVVLIFLLLISSMYNYTLDFKTFIGLVLNAIACIISCYYSYKNKDNVDEQKTLYDNFPKVLPSYSNNKKLSKIFLKNLIEILENQKLFGKINPYTNTEIENYEDIKEYYKQYLNDRIDHQ